MLILITGNGSHTGVALFPETPEEVGQLRGLSGDKRVNHRLEIIGSVLPGNDEPGVFIPLEKIV